MKWGCGAAWPLAAVSMSVEMSDSDFAAQLREQDALLEVLGESVARQSHMASTIGAETEEQLLLLDRLDDRMSRTTLRVEREAERVRQFSWKSSTGALWLVVVVLVVVLCVVLVLAAYIPRAPPQAATTAPVATTASAAATTAPSTTVPAATTTTAANATVTPQWSHEFT